jgi:hypothetical protein
VLPAVSSLKALRELAKVSHASEPYIGFGDPLLDGDPTKFKDDAAAAKLAREKRCDPTLSPLHICQPRKLDNLASERIEVAARLRISRR